MFIWIQRAQLQFSLFSSLEILPLDIVFRCMISAAAGVLHTMKRNMFLTSLILIYLSANSFIKIASKKHSELDWLPLKIVDFSFEY